MRLTRNTATTLEYDAVLKLSFLSKGLFVTKNHSVHPMISFQNSFHSKEIFVHVNLNLGVFCPDGILQPLSDREPLYMAIFKCEGNAIERPKRESRSLLNTLVLQTELFT